MIEIATIATDLMGANCYIAYDKTAKEALIVDPGLGAAKKVKKFCDEHGVKPSAVLLTHGHADHIWDVAAVGEDNGRHIPVYIPSADKFWLDAPADELGVRLPALHWRKPERVLPVPIESWEATEGVFIRMIPAPGHSPGSAIFLVAGNEEDTPLAFCGDVIFASSIGRTDLPHGSESAMRESIRTLADVMDPRTRLLPGHGSRTTWRNELENNPYVLRAIASS